MAAPAGTNKPHGRAESMTQILAAARTLFAERGFDAVSVRDVADLANVNHALVHRHFGTKEGLLHELMRAEAKTFRDAAGDVSQPAEAMLRLFAANAADPTFSRILAYSLLSRNDTTELLVEGGALGQIVEALTQQFSSTGGSRAQGQHARERAQQATALATAMSLGWLLFEPFLAAATGMQPSAQASARDRLLAVVAELVGESGDDALTA